MPCTMIATDRRRLPAVGQEHGVRIAPSTRRLPRVGRRGRIRVDFWDGEGLISVREFSWQHLITLFRYRAQVLPLDYELFLTHGNQASLPAMLSSMNLGRGVYMGVYRSDNGVPDLIGQMRYTPGERSARMSFLAPEPECDTPSLSALMENFVQRAGRYGAFHLLAELDERHPSLAYMRRAGFSVFAWQHIWHFAADAGVPGELRAWQPARNGDQVAVRSLYHSLVPPLVQAAEPLSMHTSRGLVFRHSGEVLAYAEAVYGPRGIYLYPLLHPAVENVPEVLADLVQHVPGRRGRPVYFTIRSYQAWMEPALQQLDGSVLPRQALLVKHLVQAQRVEAPARLGVLEARQAEPTASIASHIEGYEPTGGNLTPQPPSRIGKGERTASMAAKTSLLRGG